MLTQYFKRPDNTTVTGQQLIKIVSDYISTDPKAQYEFTVGTDSQSYDKTKMVEVIAVHRVGKGGILYGLKDNKEILFTKDHIIPKSKGGRDRLDNYQTMCCICNELKVDELEDI